MIERWRTTTTLLYIAVFWSCICCDNVCFADGFRNLVSAYIDVHRFSNSSCPVEVPMRFSHDLTRNLPLSGTNPQSNSTHHSSHRASSGNCTNNLTAADSLRHPTSVLEPTETEPPSDKTTATGEAHQPIATFDEWTKEKLKQEHRKVVPPASTSDTGLPSTRTQEISPAAAATRNYASKECGAKVLLSNPEAENTKAILNEKEKDEYMRNPCEKAENKFVIVELCETIQPRSIEFANYELFSSGPRTIRLWSAERFPGGEWRQLTELTAMDSRQIQQFPIPVSGVYAKFIKVELLSHYGNEHYCTLSVLKVLGISMVDEYEAEAEAASVVHVRNNVGSTTEVQQNITTTESPEAAPTPSTPSEMSVEAKANDISTVTVAPSASKDEISGSNPTVIDLVDEVSGHLISKFVDVMKDKFGRGKDNSSRTMKECSIYSPFSACYFCPKDGSYIYPRQFCQAFVWKAPISISLSRNEKRPPAAFTARRGMSSLNRLRRSRFAFLQRKSPKYLQSAAPDIVPQQANPSQETTRIPESPNGKVVSTPETPQQHQHQQQQQQQQTHQNPRPTQPVPSDAWPASSTSHKESVFMKLNKRIAALELNMSLSSEYLSELSRQYVAQTDEHQKHMKQAKKVVDEAVEAIYARVNATLAHKIAVLRQEVDMLSGWLSSMRMTASKVTVSRFTRGRERPVHEKCVPQPTQLHRYSPPDDGLWTTEQVVYMVITTQLVTVLLLAVLNFCYQRFMTEQPLSDDQRSQIEELVNERVMDAIRKSSSLSQYYDNGNPTWVQRSAPVEDSCSLHTDGCSCFAAECSSSSQVTNSDDSSTEEMHSTDGCPLLSPEVHAIASVA
ncbi:hypothetical protein Aduo_017896 [Ancylostoma duodenale]